MSELIQWLNTSQAERQLGRKLARIDNKTELAVAQVHGEVVRSVAVIRGLEYIGHEAYRSMESLAQHESRSASSDPFVADEYSYVRRVIYGEIAEEARSFRRGAR